MRRKSFLNTKLRRSLTSLGFKEEFVAENLRDQYASYVFYLDEQKLIGLDFSKEVNDGGIIYWFTNMIPLDEEEGWLYLDVEKTKNLIKSLMFYKNWLEFFKKELTKISKELDLKMEEI